MIRKASNKFFAVFLIFSLIFISYPSSSSAEFVWNSTLGRFVRTDTTIMETAEEQFAYANEMKKKGELDEAVKAYEILFRTYPNTLYAQDALMLMAEIQEEKRDFFQAFKNYQQVVDLYPYSDKLDTIVERQFRIGNVFLGGEKGRIFNLPIMPSLPKAIEVFQTVSQNAPFSEYGEKSQFNLGIAYRKKGEHKEAIEAFKTFIANYPKSLLKAEAVFQIAEIRYKRAVRKYNDEDSLRKAKGYLEDYVVRFPDTEDADVAKKMIQDLIDRDAERIYNIAFFYEEDSYLESAVFYYKEVISVYPDSVWADRASDRLAAFSDPAKFIHENETEVQAKIDKFAMEETGLEEKFSQGELVKDEYKEMQSELEGCIKQAKLELKRIQRDKKRQITLRWEALRRKQRELKERERKLKEKEERLKENHSDDLEKAILRWKDSLDAEWYALKVEERELLALERRLGIRRIINAASLFFNPEKSIRDTKEFRAKAMNKLHDQKKYLLEEKAAVLKEINNYKEQIAVLRGERKSEDYDLSKSSAELKKMNQFIAEEEDNISSLKKELKDKEEEFYKKTGTSYVSAAKNGGAIEQQLGVLRKQLELKKKTLEKTELVFISAKQQMEKEQQGKENSADNEKVIAARTLTQQEQRAFRKEYNNVKKNIYRLHAEVDDILEQKQDVIREMETALQAIKENNTSALNKMMRTASKPAGFLLGGVKSFLFGIEKKEKTVVKNAVKISKKAELREKELIEMFTQKLAAQDALIQERDVEILRQELVLENLMESMKSPEQSEAVTGSSSADRVGALSREISTLEREVTELESRIENLVNKMIKAKSSAGEETEQTAEDSSFLKSTIEKTTDQIKLREDKLKEMKEKYAEVEGEVEKASVSEMVKSSDKNKAELQKKIAKIKKEMKHSVKDLLNIIGRQEDILKKQEAFLNDKIKFIKKQSKKMENLQVEALSEMKTMQKDVFAEIDAVKTELSDAEKEKIENESLL